ncbi:conserved hypothetical protein [Ricinus communis]|uniref:Uncharacterized protein n=1 Tax=Ricinus communis TaxID=3988 RepID=B9SWA3_RICCO|nr:conserved hypothetical protein [Ricinus communis]
MQIHSNTQKRKPFKDYKKKLKFIDIRNNGETNERAKLDWTERRRLREGGRADGQRKRLCVNGWVHLGAKDKRDNPLTD